MSSTPTAAEILADIERLSALAKPRRSIVAHPTMVERICDLTARETEAEARLRILRPLPIVAGMPVYATELLVRRRQVRFPRSKRRRIRKKWAKRERNWVTEPDPHVYFFAEPEPFALSGPRWS